MTPSPQVVVVGGGLAGLSCAVHLREMGISCTILEASDAPGGRIRTDEVDGFRLDRGFQVLLTAYPEARELLDYDRLQLRPFFPGALVRYAGRFHIVADPFRRPLDAMRSVFNPVGTMADKFRVATLRRQVLSATAKSESQRQETTTLERLRAHGFTPSMVDRFFRPFLGGVLLDKDLQASSRMFEFVFRMFAMGGTAVPAMGMGEIPRQLAARLPADSIRLGVRAVAAEPGRVLLQGGEQVPAPVVVVATDGPETGKLTRLEEPVRSRGVTCLYFAADRRCVDRPILILDGDGKGPVTNVCCMSEVSAGYAPSSSHLISASVIGVPDEGDVELERKVRSQMGEWFGGGEVARWRLLRIYRIPHALPDQAPPTTEPGEKPLRLATGLYVCGDHRHGASINGALESGRRVAAAISLEIQS